VKKICQNFRINAKNWAGNWSSSTGAVLKNCSSGAAPKKIMKKINIIGVVIAILLLGGIIWASRSADKNAALNNTSNKSAAADSLTNLSGSLSAEEAAFDFGAVSMAAGNVRHSFKIKNNSGQPVTIAKIYTSCMCTTAELIKGDKKFGPFEMPGHGYIPKINEIVAPGEEAEIEVVFDPTAHGPAGVGRIQRAVTVENSSGQPFNLQISALVTP